MCRPLKDIVAELEAKYSSCMLCDLKERKHTIEGFEHDIDYLFKSFEKYKEDVKFVLNHKLDLDIIRRATLNLVLILQQLCESVIPYRNSIEFYLLDEQYEKHSDWYSHLREVDNEFKVFWEKLKLHYVFNDDSLDYNDVMNRFEVFDESLESGISSVPCIIQINADEIKKMNTAELQLGLNRQLSILSNNLWCLKMNFIEHDTEINKEIYELNYLLYAKSYWPSKVINFRSHIEMQKLRANVDIAGLEKLRHETTHEFEYHTDTGKIWRDYSEDIPQMVIQMKKTIKQEEQWEYFFKTIFEIEEFDRWIEELKNPQVPGSNISYPESNWDKIFKDAIDVAKIKPVISSLLPESPSATDWFVVHKILEEIEWLQDNTDTHFISWVNDVYGWPNKAKNFKRILPGFKKEKSLDWNTKTITSGTIALAYKDLADAIRNEFVTMKGRVIASDNTRYFKRPDLYIHHTKQL